MNLRKILFATSCLALPLAAPLAAHAQPVKGPYITLEGGSSIAQPVPFREGPSAPSPRAGKFHSRMSYAGVIGIGYGFGDGVRVELDGNYYHNTLHKSVYYALNGSTMSEAMSPGGMNTYGPMLNAFYDIPVNLPITPYVGAGAGYQWRQFSHAVNDGDGYYIGGTQGSVAVDVIAGVSYPLQMVPGLALTAEYRFMQLVENQNYESYDPSSGTSFLTKIGQQTNHTFLVGLRYQLFNPPPPPPVAPAPAPAPIVAPAPAPARTFLVFFDWDKATLTPRATKIVAKAAADSKTSSVTTLQVSGYTDTSGPAKYNMVLSERRAKAVASQLESDGVPASEIEIHAYGETHLLVPTGPDVREPQNRRVEIVLQ